MDPEPPNYLSVILNVNFNTSDFSLENILLFFILIILILSSALISGSENAFFSLTPKDKEELEENDDSTSNKIIELIKDDKNKSQLLATILIINNFINIGIVIASDYLIRNLLGTNRLEAIGQYFDNLFGLENFTALQIGNFFNFLITVVGVTFVLVLFGEVMPKIYAKLNNLKFAGVMAGPLSLLTRWISFLSSRMVNYTDLLEKGLSRKINAKSISKEHIDKAIELTVENNKKNKDEFDILKGIVKFNDVEVKEIMKPRVDVVAIDKDTDYKSLLNIIKSSGYSRIPVFEDDFDNIIGILYVKDLIGKKNEDSFHWQSIIREDILYTPETKKINDQLKEFQRKKVHLAIVVDEYGGSAGLITLEDIMEEIIGEITDEFDNKSSIDFVKVGKNGFIFDGKSSIHDVAKVIDVDSDIFDPYKGEADSIAGMLLEINGVLPKELTEFSFEHLTFIAKSVNERRIVKVQVNVKSKKNK